MPSPSLSSSGRRSSQDESTTPQRETTIGPGAEVTLSSPPSILIPPSILFACCPSLLSLSLSPDLPSPLSLPLISFDLIPKDLIFVCSMPTRCSIKIQLGFSEILMLIMYMQYLSSVVFQ